MMEEKVEEWRDYHDQTAPEEKQPPPPLQEIDGIHLLIVLKCLRPDRLATAIRVRKEFIKLTIQELVKMINFLPLDLCNQGNRFYICATAVI